MRDDLAARHRAALARIAAARERREAEDEAAVEAVEAEAGRHAGAPEPTAPDAELAAAHDPAAALRDAQR